jgi:hypothetical protein
MHRSDTDLVKPDAVPPSVRHWSIPWRGDDARMSLMSIPPDGVGVQVDGREVARFARPTLKAPWSEAVLPCQGRSVKVVQIAFPRSRYRTLVFVDGVDLDQGRGEAVWRAAAPLAMDDFEAQVRGSLLLGAPGALILGAAAALPGIGEWGRGGDPVALLLALGGFVIAASWMAAIIGFARWLTGRKTWPVALRLMLVGLSLPGVPVAVILLLQAATSGR